MRLLRLLVCPAALLMCAARPAAAAPPRKAYAPRPGEPARQIILKDLAHEKAIALTSFRGRKVLLVHFASWDADSRKAVPAWDKDTREAVAAGSLVVLGIAQEQHADRCRLFAQWQGISWPILHDPLNFVGIEKLPLAVLIDEHGFVRALKRNAKGSLSDLLARTYKAPKDPLPPEEEELTLPRYTARRADEARSADGYRVHGDACVLAGRPDQIREAVNAYRQAIEKDPADADAFFRLGVALSIREAGQFKEDGDAKAAREAIARACTLRPANRVFRQRRGLFADDEAERDDSYDWIPAARKAITARGEEPVALSPAPAEKRTATIEKGKAAGGGRKARKSP
jgi:tetratricopeptide (TPR) repeat protein